MQKSKRIFIEKIGALAIQTSIGLSISNAIAQQRIVKIVVPLTPGTTPDTIARAIGPVISEHMGVNHMVDNRAGASGMIGMDYVSKSNDFNTIMVVPATTVTLPFLYKNVDFDVINGFSPITQATSSSFVLSVHSSIEVRNLTEFVSWTKSSNRLFYASPGVGTHHHLSMELLKQLTGAQLDHIPYKGSSQALNDFLGGQIPCMFLPIQVAVPLAKAAKIKIIGGSLKERHPDFPDIPSLNELGAKDFHVDPWFSIWGPPKMPVNIVENFRAQIVSALNENQIKETFRKQGMIVKTTSPSELLNLTKAESKLWARVITNANIQPE